MKNDNKGQVVLATTFLSILAVLCVIISIVCFAISTKIHIYANAEGKIISIEDCDISCNIYFTNNDCFSTGSIIIQYTFEKEIFNITSRVSSSNMNTICRSDCCKNLYENNKSIYVYFDPISSHLHNNDTTYSTIKDVPNYSEYNILFLFGVFTIVIFILCISIIICVLIEGGGGYIHVM